MRVVAPADMEWQKQGACAGRWRELDVYLFPDDTCPLDEQTRTIVDGLCSGCPVQQECKRFGAENRLQGVWGGVFR